MTRNQFDAEDFANYAVYFIFSFLSFEWMNWQIPVINTDLNFVLHTFSTGTQEISITFPRLVLIGSLGYLLYTNDLDLTSHSASQIFVVFSLIWMVISPPFVPIMQALVSDVATASIGAFFVQSLGWGIVMYEG